METENNFKWEKKQKFTQFLAFKELYEKSVFLKISAQAFEAGDLLNIFLRFLGFWGSLCY